MPGGSTSVTGDVIVLVTIVLCAVSIGAVLLGLRRLVEALWPLPPLPVDDQPPSGLGRLVPVGRQVDDECRRGIAALEHWLWTGRQPGRRSP